MKVLVVGIHKVDLLLNLYNNANFQGTAFDEQMPLKMMGRMAANMKGDRAKAEKLINERQVHFDYVDLGAGSRPLKISFDGFEIETASYDEYNGAGLGSRVVESMRAEIIKQSAATQDNGFVSLLGRISREAMKQKDEETSDTVETSPRNRSTNKNSMQ